MQLYEFVVSDSSSERHVFVFETSEERALQHMLDRGHARHDFYYLDAHPVTTGTDFSVTTEQRPL